MSKAKGYGQFGAHSAEYNTARSGFPDEAFDWLWRYFQTKRPRILDVGCGTGIATRQLEARGAEVIGADMDPLMIAEANKAGRDITYVTAPTEKLPFFDASFEAVTAFSAFHWFANETAVKEIARVLVPGGTLMTVNKDDESDFRAGYRTLLARFVDGELPDIKKKLYPPALILANGFHTVSESPIYVSELYTLEAMLRYLHSVSLWNLVPSERKAAADVALRAHCEKHLVSGRIARNLTVRVLLAQKF